MKKRLFLTFLLASIAANAAVWGEFQYPLRGSQGETLLGFGQITNVDYSRNGKFLATANSTDAFVWSVDSEEPIHFFPALGEETVSDLAFSPDGEYLAVKSYDSGISTLTLWRVDNGELAARNSFNGSGTDRIIFAPDGKRLYVDLDVLCAVDPFTGEIQREYENAGYPTAFALSPDGSTLACVYKTTILMVDADTGDLQKTISIENISSGIKGLTFSPDGNWLLTHSTYRAYLLNLETGKLERTMYLDEKIGDLYHSATFTPNGKYIALGLLDDSVVFMDVQTGEIAYVMDVNARLGFQVAKTLSAGKTIQPFCPRTENNRYLFFSSDGAYLAAGNGVDIRLWEFPAQNFVRAFEGHTTDVDSLDISPDGKTIAAFSGDDESIRLWDRETGRVSGELPLTKYNLYEIEFSSDGKWLFGKKSYPLTLYNMETGQIERTYDLSLSEGVLSPDGERIAAYSYQEALRLLDARTGEEILLFSDPPDRTSISNMQFSRDGSFLWASDETSIGKWDAQTGELISYENNKMTGINCFDASPDNRHVLIVKGNALQLFDSQTKKLTPISLNPNPLTTLSYASEYLYNIKFTPDGKRFVSFGKEIFLWDFETFTPLHRFGKMDTDASDVAMSKDGAFFACGQKETIRIWDIPKEFQTAQAQEWADYK